MYLRESCTAEGPQLIDKFQQKIEEFDPKTKRRFHNALQIIKQNMSIQNDHNTVIIEFNALENRKDSKFNILHELRSKTSNTFELNKLVNFTYYYLMTDIDETLKEYLLWDDYQPLYPDEHKAYFRFFNKLNMFVFVLPIDREESKSIEPLRIKAEQGDAKAQLKLGLRYGNGRGVERDNKESMKWLKLAADQGNAHAQFYLGGMLRFSDSSSISQNREESAKWMEKAAIQEHVDAQSSVCIKPTA